MNTDEINRYIHEEIMGNHIHTPTLNEADDTGIVPGRFWYCTDCGLDFDNLDIVPDYCSDDSPRRWLNEVVAKLRERSGTPYPYITALDQIVHGEWTLASAEQIARACVEAHKESKK